MRVQLSGLFHTEYWSLCKLADTYFKCIDELNFSSQQQLVLQLWMDHLESVAHRIVADIWKINTHARS